MGHQLALPAYAYNVQKSLVLNLVLLHLVSIGCCIFPANTTYIFWRLDYKLVHCAPDISKIQWVLYLVFLCPKIGCKVTVSLGKFISQTFFVFPISFLKVFCQTSLGFQFPIVGFHCCLVDCPILVAFSRHGAIWFECWFTIAICHRFRLVCGRFKDF